MGGVWSWAHLSEARPSTNPSRRRTIVRDHPPRALPTWSRVLRGSRSRDPHPRPCAVADSSLLGTEPIQAQLQHASATRCSHHGGCTIYGSRSVRTQVSPRWSARYTSSHHRQSGVREGSRFTEHPPLTANNSRDGARTLLGPSPHPDGRVSAAS